MNCLECRGACCEELVVRPVQVGDDEFGGDAEQFPKALAQFLRTRATHEVPGGYVIPTRCPQLTDDGLCGCHDDKPLVCAFYPSGGEDCLGAVRRRRTPEQYQLIREEGDPEVIHG